jgi:hypothetical protein
VLTISDGFGRMAMGNGGWATVLNVEAIGAEMRGNGGRDGYSGDDSFYRAGEMWGRRVEEGDCRLEVGGLYGDRF